MAEIRAQKQQQATRAPRLLLAHGLSSERQCGFHAGNLISIPSPSAGWGNWQACAVCLLGTAPAEATSSMVLRGHVAHAYATDACCSPLPVRSTPSWTDDAEDVSGVAGPCPIPGAAA